MIQLPSKIETNKFLEETGKKLNTKILEITMTINEQYPELSNFIEEMPVAIPNEKCSEITLKNLKAYYDSLNSMVNKYKAHIVKPNV